MAAVVAPAPLAPPRAPIAVAWAGHAPACSSLFVVVDVVLLHPLSAMVPINTTPATDLSLLRPGR